MNRYIITCINDFETQSGYAAYAESLFDEDMNNAADAYAFEIAVGIVPVSYTHLRAHETRSNLVCRLLLEKIFF